MTEKANEGAVNIAASLEDGLQVDVPQEKEQPAPRSDGDSTVVGEVHEESAPAKTSYPIDLNTASQQELETLPGIGPVTAQKIIEYRQENEFTIIEDIQKVSGIGPATFEKIKEMSTVGAGG